MFTSFTHFLTVKTLNTNKKQLLLAHADKKNRFSFFDDGSDIGSK